MNKLLVLALLLAGAPLAQAADPAAGRQIATTVCAACHGANGVSVSQDIPNLAAQRAAYIEAQLEAFRDGARKADGAKSPTAIMNALAPQLRAEDIANVAAYFASQPGATPGARSALLASVARSRVTFPEGPKGAFTKYLTVNVPAARRVVYYHANAVALAAARAGRPLPDGSVLLEEIHAAKLDAGGTPVVGADGFYVADRLLLYTAMARGAGWGRDFPDMLRNGDWNYAAFTAEQQPLPGVNQAECLACHKPLDKTSYVFTLKQLSGAK